MYYQIRDTLVPCTIEDCKSVGYAYVALVTMREFVEHKSIFNMGIDMEFDEGYDVATQIEVNYDSLTGSFSIPDKKDMSVHHNFYFALDERGIVFINDDGYAQQMVEQVRISKKWKMPCLERFLYDFLEMLLKGDNGRMNETEKEMDLMEDKILEGDYEGVMERLLDIRSDLLDLHNYYGQLIDLAQELEENENGFFDDENLRFFHQYVERVSRLQAIVTALRDHTLQVRDLQRTQMETRQSNNMSILTVVSTIFMPLTLLTSWYGMNFTYMPELKSPLAYPLLIVLMIVIVAVLVYYFKKKDLL